MSNTFNHLKTIIKHKYYVGKYCFMCGLYWQGITHDLSKFSPTEFWESVKYCTGKRSPIDKCKEVNGYSNAWFHHKGRNKHHWEYWVDNFESGMTFAKIPFKYALELICDYLGAGKAYNEKGFTIKDEYQWWIQQRNIKLFHPDTKLLIDIIMIDMLNNGIKETLTDKQYLRQLKFEYDEYPAALQVRNPFTK